jgi:hypothetical protein
VRPVTRAKIILLNALVTSSKIPLTIRTIPITLEDVKTIVKNREVVSFIGHEATANLLSQLLHVEVPVNRSMYDPQPGDLAVVVRLKKRLERPEDVKNVRLEDIEFILVEYREYA